MIPSFDVKSCLYLKLCSLMVGPLGAVLFSAIVDAIADAIADVLQTPPVERQII